MNNTAIQARSHFPILQKLTFLNSCSYGALSDEVRLAVNAYLDERQSKGTDWLAWCDQYDLLRADFAALIGAEPKEIAVTASVSAAVNSLISAVPLNKGRNRLIFSAMDFPSVAQILYAQQARGAEVVCIEHGDGPLSAERLAAEVDERTALVAISHVCYRNGVLQDIAPLVRLTHDKGALFLLDAFQSLGTMDVQVDALEVDFLTGGSLKYLLGTAGVAWLYARHNRTDRLQPLTSGWFAQSNPHTMDATANDFAPDARRFEGGTPPVINVFAARAGLKLIKEFGPNNIRKQVLQLAAQLKDAVAGAGWQMATPAAAQQHGSLLAIRSNDAPQLVAKLAEADIVTSDRDGNLRISLHIYNNSDDMERLLQALHKHSHLLTPT